MRLHSGETVDKFNFGHWCWWWKCKSIHKSTIKVAWVEVYQNLEYPNYCHLWYLGYSTQYGHNMVITHQTNAVLGSVLRFVSHKSTRAKNHPKNYHFLPFHSLAPNHSWLWFAPQQHDIGWNEIDISWRKSCAISKRMDPFLTSKCHKNASSAAPPSSWCLSCAWRMPVEIHQSLMSCRLRAIFDQHKLHNLTTGTRSSWRWTVKMIEPLRGEFQVSCREPRGGGSTSLSFPSLS